MYGFFNSLFTKILFLRTLRKKGVYSYIFNLCRGRVSKSLKDAIFIGLMGKLLIFSLGFVMTYLNEGPSHPISILMHQFCRWDSNHYISIAKNWYSNVGEQRFFIVFLPLYPILIRLTTFDYRYMNLSALLISNVSSIIAMVYLFKLAKLDFGDDVAKRSVLYFSIYPTAYFLCAIYTEGLFLALATACVYYARKGRWLVAGVLGMLSSLTRIFGIILLPTLIIEYLLQRRWKWREVNINIFWSGLVLVGFLIYLIINYKVTGDFFTFMEIERTHWYQSIDPLLGLERAWRRAISASFPENITVGSAQIIFALLGLLGVAGSFFRLRLSYSVYMLFTWMMSVSTSFWISVPRYVMAMFPLFILLSLCGRRKEFNYIAISVFSVSLYFFTILFSLGQWAF